ncbi:uncharacterized protein LOC106387655 isoform X1 [Brassica napus]|uniref:uncharacterized protein LOC106387655 isoform X1 n=1 Tax=Brassica napus TaxID=3708 RepID=UPI00207AFFD3|nr:uncharacterized protein LOC106387655 isoform X1 [Brassica napus]
MVARLEGEKQSLEKIVDERAKQQAREAAELQTNMMETLDAADLEKQKHNNTRMEVFSHLAGLEATNTELTRSFAAGQKKLQTQIDQVTLLREQVEVKESALEVLKRKTSNIRGSGNLLNKLDASRGDIFEHQMLEAEISLLTDKIGRLQDKANKLEADISTMKKDLEEPTEVETELRRRLDQLTDHLIQKQSQVEALSSEKATILFRIEARLIEDNKGMSATEASSQDLEAGEWKLSGSKLKPAFQSKIRSGKKHLGWLVMQLNAIFVSGTVFLRRNPTAKKWALVYLVCLHLWVRPKTGPIPRRWRDGRSLRERRERANFRREKGGHKTWRKGNSFLFLVDVIFPLLCISSFPNHSEFSFWILFIYLHLVILI